ncbi:MAG: elongation factor P hydroxylase [Pseudomonadota bacterium]
MEIAELQHCFESEFLVSYNTRLEGGYEEPFYRAFVPGEPAVICFKEDFVSSALHEIAHWCIAGARRRRLDDYGYWYTPVRRGQDQRRFEVAERAPQALEWILSVAAGQRFRVSFDNFDEPASYLAAHRRSVRDAALQRLEAGLPPRAARFAGRLAALSGVDSYLNRGHYRELPD